MPYTIVPATQQLDLVHELGATYLRMELDLSYPLNLSEARASLGGAEAFFANASKRGVKILPYLMPGNPGLAWGFGLGELSRVEAAAAQTAEFVASELAPLGATVFGIGGEWNSLCLDVARACPKTTCTQPGGCCCGACAGDYNMTQFKFFLAALQGLNRGVKQACPSCRTQVTTSGWLNYGYLRRAMASLHRWFTYKIPHTTVALHI